MKLAYHTQGGHMRGKKIKMKDGFKAIFAILKYKFFN